MHRDRLERDLDAGERARARRYEKELRERIETTLAEQVEQAEASEEAAASS
jgi:hypothetical protein